MLHYSSKDLSKKQQYKFLSGSIIPRPIAWVTTMSTASGVVNAAPFSFFNAASSELPLITLAILRKQGHMKDTARNILENHELVIHLVDDQVLAEMNQTAASLSEDESEILLNHIETVPSRSVSVPAIKKAKLRMEATLYQHVALQDHEGDVITDLIIAEVTDFHFSEAVFDEEKEYILPEALQPVARLAGTGYAHISNITNLERPK
ncbi:flavin reductase family protein [Enterococcus sp. BWM-S5]|uniref:Flavin reductase family protein n=1 Tax=Enterococcus larvae TaxID=2794352 RepID=A0ABS4CIC3_9ENTE|nr:flavin reductase family protein [Enterococcus larvae]MBP1046379.1 flavin reductase family protein [Enterococcus larvae]